MVEIEHEGHIIKIYNNADELPIRRFQRFQKYSVFESGIGSSLDSIALHFTKLFQLLSHNKTAEALTEAKNLFYNWHTILEEIPIPGLAFSCLIYSIDGIKNDDLAEDALAKVVTQLDELGISREFIEERVSSIKKKVFDELKTFCSAYFNNDLDFQFYARLKQKIAIIGQMIIEGETNELKERLQKIEAELIEEALPANFDTGSPENELTRMEKNFQTLCTILETNGVTNASNLTTLEFYSRLEYFKKQNSALKKGVKSDV